MMTKEEEFEAVKRIRQVLKDNPNVRMTQRYQTEKDRLKRLLPGEDLWKWYSRTASRTAYLHKAVLRASVVDLLRRILAERDEAIRAGRGSSGDQLTTALKLLDRAQKHGVFDAHPRGEGPGRWTEYWKEHALERPKALRASKKTGRAISKRIGLGKLPPDWRERVAAGMNFDPRLDLLSITGCRPVELAGIKMRIEDSKLVMEIPGAKVKETGHQCGQPTGQKMRLLTVDPASSPAAARIFRRVSEGSPIPDLSAKALHALRQRLAKRSRELFPGIPQISFYSYRHQLVSDLKSNGGDPAEIAKIAGHQSVRTQQNYGRAGSGKGQGVIVRARASSQIRGSARVFNPRTDEVAPKM